MSSPPRLPSRMGRRIAHFGALVALVLLPSAPSATAAPLVHAHRGGPVLDGAPRFPENTMPAFQHAALVERAVLEVDAKLTQDGVPIVMHADTLDRTTNCSGAVNSLTAERLLRECRSDVLGSPGSALPSVAAPPTTPIPTLREVLVFARDSGATVNLEIKNVPTDDDFDPTSGYANRVMDEVLASALPKERLIVQSFWPPNLDVARARLPGASTSLLTLGPMNEGAPEFAAANGYGYVSPQWPVTAAYVSRAHALGRKVVPYTLDKQEDVRGAAAAGVDAVITDDPAMAARALGLARPFREAPGVPTLRISRQPVRLTGRGEAPVRLACEHSGPVVCAGTLRLATARRVRDPSRSGGPRRVRLGARRFSIRAGRPALVRVRLSREGRRLVRRLGRVDVRATATGRDPQGRAISAVARFVLRA